MRWLALATLALGACMSHEPNTVAVRQEDCSRCHQPDFDATAAPPHRTAGFPESCVDCHRTAAWRPALAGLHPENPFKIRTGPHEAIQCLACHDLDAAPSSVAGANTDCVRCHPDSSAQRESHAGVRGPLGQAYAYTVDIRNFCLACHPAGLAGKHPNDRFPLRGPHATPCTTCHDRASGQPDAMGANTTCTEAACHGLSKMDAQHREEGARYTTQRGDGSNRHFCLASGCHPDGRTE